MLGFEAETVDFNQVTCVPGNNNNNKKNKLGMNGGGLKYRSYDNLVDATKDDLFNSSESGVSSLESGKTISKFFS